MESADARVVDPTSLIRALAYMSVLFQSPGKATNDAATGQRPDASKRMNMAIGSGSRRRYAVRVAECVRLCGAKRGLPRDNGVVA